MLSAALVVHDLLEDTKCTEKDILNIDLTILFEGKEMHEVIEPLTRSISEASRIIKLAEILTIQQK